MPRQVVVTDELRHTLLNSREAERFAGVTKGYFTYRRSAGMSPPYLREGFHILYRKSDLEAWVKERRTYTEVAPAVKK